MCKTSMRPFLGGAAVKKTRTDEPSTSIEFLVCCRAAVSLAPLHTEVLSFVKAMMDL
jgi:hypothetical protein